MSGLGLGSGLGTHRVPSVLIGSINALESKGVLKNKK